MGGSSCNQWDCHMVCVHICLWYVYGLMYMVTWYVFIRIHKDLHYIEMAWLEWLRDDLNFTVGLCLACLSYFFYKLLDIAEKSWSKREWWNWPLIYSEKNLAENISVFIHAKVDQIDRQMRSWGLVCREEGGDQGANGKSFSFRGNKFRCSPIFTSQNCSLSPFSDRSS